MRTKVLILFFLHFMLNVTQRLRDETQRHVREREGGGPQRTGGHTGTQVGVGRTELHRTQATGAPRFLSFFKVTAHGMAV